VRALVQCPLIWLPLLLMLQACSAVMEARRPEPVDFSNYQPGRSRDSVIDELGNPETTANQTDGIACDSYHLYTKGPRGFAKTSLELLEGAAAIGTMGLADVALVPAEYGIKSEKHPVAICYKQDRFVSVTSDGPMHGAPQAATSEDLASLDAALKAELSCDRPVEVGGVSAFYVNVEAKSPGPLRVDAPVALPVGINDHQEGETALDADSAITESGGDGGPLVSQLKHQPPEALLTTASAFDGVLIVSEGLVFAPLAPYAIYLAVKHRHHTAIESAMARFPLRGSRSLKTSGYMFFRRKDYKALEVTIGDDQGSRGRSSSAQCILLKPA
jgi:hypothetical protein